MQKELINLLVPETGTPIGMPAITVIGGSISNCCACARRKFADSLRN